MKKPTPTTQTNSRHGSALRLSPRSRVLAQALVASAFLVSAAQAAEPYSLKKGIGYQAGKGLAYQANVLHLTNVSWYYDWGVPTTRNTLVDPTIEFVPMVWWGNGLPNSVSEAATVAKIAGLNVPGFYPVENLLGFNEPDHTDQANMTVAQVLGAWPALENIALPGGLNIGSAAMTGFHAMQQEFMTTALSTGLKVDFMTFHDYPGWGTSFNGIMNNAQQYYNAYGKDIWITEYNMADWSGTAGYTLAQGYTWIAESLYRLEQSPIITRYAIFPWDTTHAAGYASAVLNPGTTASLTPVGELYGEYRSADIHGPFAQTWYFVHNKSSHQRLAHGPALDTIFQKNDSVNYSLVPAGNGNHYLVNKSTGNRLAYNGTTLSMVAPTVTDSSVQWSVTDSANGWDYLNHVGTGKRLSGNPLSMVAGTTTTDVVKWMFIRPHVPAPVYAPQVLAGGATLNGNFDSPASGSTFASAVNWKQLGTGPTTTTATLPGTNSGQYNGTGFASLGYLPGFRVFGLNTGHAMVAGDRYDLSYYWSDGYLWNDSVDQVRVTLFTTSDNTITGARTNLATSLSGTSKTDNTYEAVKREGVYTATAADAGKTLFVAIDTTIVDEGYAGLDNFELSIPRRTAPTEAPAFTGSAISATAGTVNVAYSGSIAGAASDSDSPVLTYSRATAGPKWLQVAPNGTLSGTPSAADVGVNSIVVHVQDGNGQVGNVDTAVLTITVQPPPNQAPAFLYGSAWSLNFTEDTYANHFNSWRVSDPEGDAMTFAKVSGPSWVSVHPSTAEIRGTPRQADVGTQTLVISVTDGSHAPVQATVTLNIANVNDAPEFTVDPITGAGATGGVAYSGTIANAVDGDGDALTYSKVSGPAWLVVNPNGSLAGTSGAGDVGANSFTVQAADGNGGVDTAVLTIAVANGAPGFTAGSAWSLDFTEDAYGSRSNLSRVSDPEGDALSFTKVSGPSWIAVTATGFEVQGTPVQADVGSQTLVVSVTDGVNSPIQATITVNVASVNDAPAFTQDPINGAGATGGVAYSGSVANATDEEGDTLMYSKVGGPAWLSVAANGALSGTPGAGNVGANTFTVQAADGNGGVDTAVLNIQVANGAPSFLYGNTWTLNFTEDVYTNEYNSWRVSDPEADPLSYTKVSGPSWVSVHPTTAEIRGTPGQADVGSQTLVLSVSDGVNAPVQATVTLNVANVNDVPVFTVDPINGGNATGGVAYTGSIANATDADGDALTYSKVSGPAWLTVNADGSLSGTSGAGNVGANTFTVQVADGNGGVDTAALTISVANGAPRFLYGNTWTLNFTEDTYTNHFNSWRVADPEGDTISYAKVSGPSWITVTTNTLEIRATPRQANVGTYTLVVSAKDALHAPVQATITIVVANVNDAPVFTVDPITGANGTTGVAYAGSIANATDEDGDPRTYSKVSGPAWLTVNANGSLAGTPAAANLGVNTFSVRVSDGKGGTDTAVLRITVVAP
jgi:hypothetical protein